MPQRLTRSRMFVGARHHAPVALFASLIVTCAFSAPALADHVGGGDRGGDGNHGFGTFLWPGNLLISRSVYESNPGAIVPGVTQLPPGCVPANCVTATANAAYPFVFNNDAVDASFGITSKIFLDQLTPAGHRVSSLEVPNSAEWGVGPKSAQMVTSFSSKSEIGLNLSTSGRYVTFMGYVAPVGAVDVSNSNTPGVIDPTNPVPGAYYRAVAQLDRWGRFHFTETNAYSGNNGRAAILNDEHGADVLYTSGNAGNGGNPQPNGIILGAGAQIMSPSYAPESTQSPGTPAPVGSFNVTELGDKVDKIGKDTNFRGLTIYDNVVYYTKGSGSNGVNTVYFLDTTGTACPDGSGVPAPNAALPTSAIAYDPALLQTEGVTPDNMCVLSGFPTGLAKNDTTFFPFGIWFANAHTLYVANEGDGTNTYSTATGTYTDAAAQTTAGLQKWILNGSTWQLAYTLQSGLSMGQPYMVPGYPTADNAATGLPWAPATDGLRNITGRVGRDGKVTIWGVTSTVSGSGDQGADPNKVVAITDDVGATTPSPGESFRPVEAAANGEVLRGVSLTPGTESDHGW
jgi:hypothetical protein